MIDKSLSQYQQLVKKGKGNRRPGYRGDNWGGPSYGGSSSSSSGGDRSHDRGGGQHQAAAQRATPAPSPHRDDSAERAAQAAADALNAAREAEARESAREKAIQVAALTPKTIEPIRSAHVDTPTQIAEQKEIDLYGYQDAKAKAPTTLKPKTITYDKGVPFTDTPIKTTVGQTLFDPRTSQNVLLDRGTGITGGLKTAGKGILEMALMPFLPKPVRTAWSGYKRAKQLEGLAKRTGILDKDIVPTLNISNLRSSIDKGISGRQFDPKDPIGWTGEQKRNKTFHEGKGDGQQETTVQEAIAGKTSLGADALGLPELQKRMAMLHQLKQNEDFWNQLTDVQKRNINMAMMDYFKMIDQYSVKPNEGRIRDIG